MKILNVESIYGNDVKIVKSRKDFVCDCCGSVIKKGSDKKSFKCANANDFFELKFCLNCTGKYQVKTSWN